MKNYITLFLLAGFIFTACNNTETVNTPVRIEIPEFNPEEEAGMDEQIEANEILTEISEPKTSKSKSLYDEYYGGGFMDKHGNLTIMVKGDTAMGKKIVDPKKNNGKIKFVKCKYSLAELNALMDSITDYIKNNKNSTSANITLWFASQWDNTVEVHLLDTTKTAIDDFKEKISNSPAIKFLQGEEFHEEKSTLCCGSKISLAASAGYTKEPPFGSFAFRAKEKKGKHRIGMVTAAHVISVGKDVYIWNDIIGKCTQSILSGKVDAAFVVITDTMNYELSNYLTGDYTILSTNTTQPGLGTTVNKRGAKTGHTTGHIVDNNGQVQASNGNILTNLTFATYESSDGDSGGIIYTYVSKTSTRYTVGVHRGTNKGLRVYSKASNVLTALNLERY